MTTYYVVDGRRNPMTEEAIELMNESQAPGAIPGCTKMDIYHGTVNMNPGGHSIHDQKNDERLHDPTLHARVAYWLRPKAFSLKEIKETCKSNKISREGNKRVLAIKLAFQQLPKAVDVLDGLMTVDKTVNKKKTVTATKNNTGKKSEQSQTKKAAVAKKKTVAKHHFKN